VRIAMSDNARVTAPGFDLEPPGTYLFDGLRSTQGFALNRFALSLKRPANRERFLRDEPAYMAAYDLTPECRELIRDRDWTGLLRAGGHLQALLKLAATVGQSLYHIGAHNCGIKAEEMRAACPRRVSGIGSLD
jgi:protocatechuate 4,5-dioxygenase alpha chain